MSPETKNLVRVARKASQSIEKEAKQKGLTRIIGKRDGVYESRPDGTMVRIKNMAEDAPQLRIRIFAGPNGSGKSVLYEKIKKENPNLHFGHYINADSIHHQLVNEHTLDCSSFNISISRENCKRFFKNSGWEKKIPQAELFKPLKFTRDKILIATPPSSYHAAVLSDYIRACLLKTKQRFTFETVMSDRSKIEFMKNASSKGFKVYLYYVSTQEPLINKERVLLREKAGGHGVPELKITARYFRSLDLLLEAVRVCYRVYFFDSTSGEFNLVAEKDKHAFLLTYREVPGWFKKYVLDKATIRLQ